MKSREKEESLGSALARGGVRRCFNETRGQRGGKIKAAPSLGLAGKGPAHFCGESGEGRVLIRLEMGLGMDGVKKESNFRRDIGRERVEPKMKKGKSVVEKAKGSSG